MVAAGAAELQPRYKFLDGNSDQLAILVRHVVRGIVFGHGFGGACLEGTANESAAKRY